ncbi:MAG: hypothetical protein HPY90_05645 [Syntrophothermus sp.]|uniref:hypothetical protein n=1 Tax=Syntrophothermus sp. TaxID=2736299 RepID=UPI002580A434|nr:hypothetical protein [Syntrophothermus sp.]NSW82748.1 hypothetical protein [Syntrophothermus sp.]
MAKNRYVIAAAVILLVFVVLGIGMSLDSPSGSGVKQKLSIFDPNRPVEFPEVSGGIKEIEPVGKEEITKTSAYAASTIVRKAQKLGNPLIVLFLMMGLAGWVYGYANQRPLNRGMIMVGVCLVSLLLINYPATTTKLIFSLFDSFVRLVEKI